METLAASPIEQEPLKEILVLLDLDGTVMEGALDLEVKALIKSFHLRPEKGRLVEKYYFNFHRCPLFQDREIDKSDIDGVLKQVFTDPDNLNGISFNPQAIPILKLLSNLGATIAFHSSRSGHDDNSRKEMHTKTVSQVREAGFGESEIRTLASDTLSGELNQAPNWYSWKIGNAIRYRDTGLYKKIIVIDDDLTLCKESADLGFTSILVSRSYNIPDVTDLMLPTIFQDENVFICIPRYMYVITDIRQLPAIVLLGDYESATHPPETKRLYPVGSWKNE